MIRLNVRLVRFIIAITALLSLLGGIFFLHTLISQRRVITNNTISFAKENAELVKNQVDQFINQAKQIVTLTAQQLQSNSSPEFITSLLNTKPNFLSGLGIIDLSLQEKISGWYYVEHEDQQKLITISPTELKASSFQWINQISNTITTVHNPDPYTTMQSWIIGQRITVDQKTFLIFATISYAHLKHVLSLLSTREGGMWIITNNKGEPQIYPALMDFMATSVESPGIQESLSSSIKSSIEQKNNLVFDNTSQSWLILTPLTNLPATLVGVFTAQKSIITSIFLRHTSMLAVIAFTLFLLCLLVYWFLQVGSTVSSLWILSIISTVILSTCVAFLWYISDRYPYHQAPINSIAIRDKVSLYQFLDSISNATPLPSVHRTLSSEALERYLNFRYKKGRYVPTGLYITNISFDKPHQIEVAGYVWQRYFDKIHDNISRGVLFPQAVSEPIVEEISQSKQGNVQTIIWQFNVLLNQQISYRNYPFDIKDVNIQLWHKDFNDVITLVPDLDSYLPGANVPKPELSPHALLPGWHPIDTYFTYNIIDRTTNFGHYAFGPFGIFQSARTTTIPEFNFTVTLKRNLLETIITELLPLFVIALLLFVLLITDREQGYVNVITGASAIFFGTIVAHLKFREKIPPQEVAYFEIFFLIMYIFIAFVLAVSILNLFNSKLKLIRYKDNLISQILYWPILLLSICVVTWYYLY
ncbi:MAG: hypothetical protein ACOYT8_00770 [Candidatus Dependentiae bacterium]